MKSYFICTLFFISFFIISEEERETQIYVASEILTLNSTNEKVEAVAVKNSKIIDIGSVEELRASFPSAALVLNYQDYIFVPGFIEHHIHPFLAAVTMNSEIIAIDDWTLRDKISSGVQNRTDYLKRLSEVEARHPENQPLVSWGFHHYFHGRLTKNDLDAISSTRPILVVHRSFHEFILNTPAMKLLGINRKAFPDIREEKHLVNFDEGHFSERGAIVVLPNLMAVLAAPKKLIEGLNKIKDYIHENGITVIGNPGAMYSQEIQMAKNYTFGSLDTPFESYFFPSGLHLSEQFDLNQMLNAVKEQTSWGAGKVNFLPNHIKLFTDGAMYSQNMIMREGYLDNHQGSWLMDSKNYQDLFKLFWDADYQIHIHQNGDAALDRLLDNLEENLINNPRKDHRTTVVHFGYSAKDQLKRMKDLGVLISANPYYVTALSDLYSRQGVGHKRSQEMVRLGDAVREGIMVSLHSDMPMAPASPLQLMHSAVNRINFANKVAGPEQRISALAALKAVTINSAYVLRLEEMYGSIEVGKYANFTVLQKNPLTVPADEIKDIAVVGTIVKGVQYPVHSFAN